MCAKSAASTAKGQSFVPRNILNLARAVIIVALTFAGTALAQRKGVVLHQFTGGTDGGSPQAAVGLDQQGNMYGTTGGGGELGSGVVFEEIAPATSTGSWTYSVLYNFTGGADGCCQLSAPAFDKAGNLYGVTNNGLTGGSVFQLSPTGTGTWDFQLIANFPDSSTYDTQTPLSFDDAGRIYAASFFGGLSGCTYDSGCGTVVQFTPPATKGAAWTAKTIYEFTGGADGGNPFSSLVPGPHGVFYGAAAEGGLVTTNCYQGCGVIYQLTPPESSGGSWTESVIYTFQDRPDGLDPYFLTGDSSGALYGLACCHGTGNYYTFHIFKLTPPAKGASTWTKTVIHGFSDFVAGPNTISVGSNGVIYGAATGSLDFDAGYIFELAPPATKGGLWTFTNLGLPGGSRNPNAATPGLFGALYGTQLGGDSDSGNVFSLTP